MRYVGTWNPNEVTAERAAHAHRCITTAIEAGYTLFDHADIYCRGMCEQVFGDFLATYPNLRDRILIATKCGIRFPGDPNPDSPHRFDFSKGHILTSCEASLKRLRTDRIDLYQLHRPDVLMNPPEIAEAFEQLQKQGKVRHFGVSNFSPSFVSTLQKSLPMPLIVNQIEVHLGLINFFTDGTLDQCIAENLTPLSWSPLGGGFLGAGGSTKSDHPQHALRQTIQRTLDEVAERYNTSRTNISLAWLLKHPSKIIPIVGSSNPEHIVQVTQADRIDLSREDWYRLYVAARGQPLP